MNQISQEKEYKLQELQSARLLYPRVSEIIGKQTEKEMKSIPIDTLVNAALRGTKVHDYCTTYLQGLFVPEIEEEYKPYFNAFVNWADANIYKTLYCAVRLYDDVKRFSGEYDVIAVMKDSKQIALLDIKTSANASKSWPIQLAAYKHLCDLKGYEIDVVYNIHLKKTKAATFDNNKKMIHPPMVKVVPIGYGNLMPYWEIFSSALACYDYFDRKELPNVRL